MNKRRRYKAKRRRYWFKQFNNSKLYLFFNSDKIPYTQVNQSMDEWLGFKRK